MKLSAIVRALGLVAIGSSSAAAQVFPSSAGNLTVTTIARGLDQKLTLGNMESRRDWGRAQDYVQAMWLMLQHKTPDDYVVATGETHSVRDFVEAAFAIVDLPWEKYVERDPSFDRPTEPTKLV